MLYYASGAPAAFIVELNQYVFHPYPPPASLLFALFTLIPFAWSYLLYSIAVYIVIAVACLLYVNKIKSCGLVTNGKQFLGVLLCICCAPAFLDASFGNVNSLLLLLSVVYIGLLSNRKNVAAGIVLSIAFWLKLYPVLLLEAILFVKNRSRVLWGFSGGVVTIGLVGLQFIPISTFREFFLEIVPAYSHQTVTHAFNQSITATLYRAVLPSSMFFSYDEILVPLWIRAVALGVLLAGVSIPLIAYLKKKEVTIVHAVAFLCALIPLYTPIGWGYTFVLMYPALLLVFLRRSERNSLALFVCILCWAALAFPSFHRIEGWGIPSWIRLIYYSRYTMADLVIVAWLGSDILTCKNNVNESVSQMVVRRKNEAISMVK